MNTFQYGQGGSPRIPSKANIEVSSDVLQPQLQQGLHQVSGRRRKTATPAKNSAPSAAAAPPPFKVPVSSPGPSSPRAAGAKPQGPSTTGEDPPQVSLMALRVARYLAGEPRSNIDQRKVIGQLLPMHWASLLLARDVSDGLLLALTDALGLSLPPAMYTTPQFAAAEQRQGEGLSQHLEARLLSLPHDHAVCLVDWCFVRRSLRIRASERFHSIFMSRDQVRAGMLQQRLSCHELWARLTQGTSTENYWRLVLRTVVKQEIATGLLQVQDRIGVQSVEICSVGQVSTSPCGIHSCAWIILAPTTATAASASGGLLS